MASKPCGDLIKKPLWPSHQTTSEPAAGAVAGDLVDQFTTVADRFDH